MTKYIIYYKTEDDYYNGTSSNQTVESENILNALQEFINTNSDVRVTGISEDRYQ